MTYQANPFDAMGQSFNALQGAWDQRTRDQAGLAYAGGDARGATNALARGGMVQEAADLEYRGQQREGLISEQERAAAAERTTALMRGLQALQGVPYEQRGQVWQQIAPSLAGLMPPEIIQQLGSADMSDQNLAAFGTAIGQEAERLQLFQTRGGDIVGVSQRTGAERSRIAAPPEPFDPVDGAPQGFRWADEQRSRLEPIPGYIEGRSQISAAGRAPPRPRSSGGGSRPSGGSSAPAAPSRKPWERF